MENLVQAWLARVEEFSAEVVRKRARLNEIRSSNLGLKAAAEEDQHLLVVNSKYLSDLSIQRAHLAQKVLLARLEKPRLGISTPTEPVSGRSCHLSIPDAAAERLRRAIGKENAQMEAYNALVDQAYAEAREEELRMQQELDQVVACTRSTEEQIHVAEAAIACSTAEKHARVEEYKGLQKELGCVTENNKKLEQEVSKLREYAAKRAQQLKHTKFKVTETENGDVREAQRRRDAALARLTQVQRSNAEVERHIHLLDRQITDAQGAVQQLCLYS